jgi:hypothetical protein
LGRNVPGKDINGSHDRAFRLVGHEAGLGRNPAGVRPDPASTHEPEPTWLIRHSITSSARTRIDCGMVSFNV